MSRWKESGRAVLDQKATNMTKCEDMGLLLTKGGYVRASATRDGEDRWVQSDGF